MEEKAKLLLPFPPPWDGVVEFTKLAQEKGIDPVTWAMHVSATLGASGIELPSPDLADVLVSHICWANNVPAAWKYLEKAVSSGLAPPMVVVALLSTRVIPSRRTKPVPYRLYMEIIMRHCFAFISQTNEPKFKRILMLVNDVLHLSKRFGVQSCETGVLIVEYIFCIIWQLLEAALDDEGLLGLTSEKNLRWVNRPQDMEIDEIGNFDENRNDYSVKLMKANTVMAIEIIGKFLHHKVISRLLSLAHQNMPSHWQSFSQCLHLLAANSLALQSSTVHPETLIHWSSDNLRKVCWKYKPSQYRDFSAISSGPLASPGSYRHGSSRSAIWVPLDLYLEDAIDGSVAATNSIKIISGLVKALQAVNRTTWHDTFLGLWMAALRLVQRERDPIVGPVPHEDTRLCMLLSITILSVADVIKEDECTMNDQTTNNSTNQLKEKVAQGARCKALVSSLQSLGDYGSLLVPPPYAVSVANQAAAKAMAVISGVPVVSGYFESISMINQLNCSGNLRHLIVEACIARNLLDTSAYFWPGYVNGHLNQIPHSMSGQGPGWSTLMMGAPLTSSMINALINIPASSLAELEKVFEIAINGSDDDKISAATILCGASLIRGWNIQEYAVCLVVKLLSPPPPVDYSGTESHLISHAPVLDVVLAGISSVDCVQVFSFHGLVPELAGALMAISEVFGSCIPNRTWTLSTGEVVSSHTVFSNAFILLLRLWEFNHTPLEFILMGDGTPVGSELTPEYLLLLRNSQVISSYDAIEKQNGCKHQLTDTESTKFIFVDSFPKLKVWYRQHQSCLASTLSGLVPGTPVHQNVDSLLSMMFRKINANHSVSSATSGSSNLSGSSVTGGEDSTLRPKLPAWDIMEAVPYVVDAALTACAHGRLSPRELATGLKDLADFLPASLATIVSYFSAEVTRGVWKAADMNGTDWPSPAANLLTVEGNIKKIVAATGVDVPSVAKGSSQATLPLPLAAFVSLTITYKLDRASERFLNLAGPALENLAGCCPWPSMQIVAALWTQKVKRWTDFLTFSASRAVFLNNKNAMSQLLKSCFATTLGLSVTPGSGGGVGSLLGHGFCSRISGGLSHVAPGILYLRVYRYVRDVMFLTEEILSLLIVSVRELVDNGIPSETREKLRKSKYGMRYGQVSLISAFTQVKTASSLGATLVWLSGGCGLTQCMFLEILPSWFLSVHNSDQGGRRGIVAMLEGYALAYFSMLCAMFAWGIDSTSVWKRRPKVIGAHLQFLADALDGKISLGCSRKTWRAYVSGFLGLVVDCAPNWLLETDVALLKRLSMGLRQWNEEDLALLLLGKGGLPAMGAAAELIIASQ